MLVSPLLIGPAVGAIAGATSPHSPTIRGGILGSMAGTIAAPIGLVGGYIAGGVLSALVRRISHSPELTQIINANIHGVAPAVGALAASIAGGRLGGGLPSNVLSLLSKKDVSGQATMVDY